MQEGYHPSQLEQEIQKAWATNQSFRAKETLDQPPYYCLSMLPYPSGQLHMGHVRNYVLGDALGRYKRMLGHQVLQPIGWDAFGLPAENAAKNFGENPKAWTKNNIQAMQEQLKTLGIGYDWQREIASCDPSYYRWNQWLFLQMYQKGLAYQKESVVNWDPIDQTVLANEQVVDGKGWRSGATVEQRYIKQWFFRITSYTDELLDELDALDGWPDEVKTMQKNWIGRSSGTKITFQVADQNDAIEVFTTRADTLYGITYLALSAEHPIAHACSHNHPEIIRFIEDAKKHSTAESAMATMEKKGIQTPWMAIHPLTGQHVPIWITNYVLMNYGTGAVMGVPAHDQRDFEFAKKYNIDIQQVLTGEGPLPILGQDEQTTLIESGPFNGLSCDQAIEKITSHLEQEKQGEKSIIHRLRDWGISRQRYWGTPIPIIHCQDCGAVAVRESDLPVLLPEHVDLNVEGSPLAKHDDFYHTTCPKCGEKAHRETDTMDTFVDSSWYYLRYTCPDQHDHMLDDRANFWAPVDQYIGGIEHATLHLLYARFIHKVLRDLGLVNSNEPFKKLLTQGMVLKDGQKMSKSKGNVVPPMPLIERYGADTVRLFTLFAAPPEQSIEWKDGGIEGAHRFLKKLWRLADTQSPLLSLRTPQEDLSLSPTQKTLRHQTHSLLKQISYDYERMQFNTVVSSAMKLLNLISEQKEASWPLYEAWSVLLSILSPITPHITQHIWQKLEMGSEMMVGASWPTVDPRALEQSQTTLVVQINGKRRGHIDVAADASEEAIEKAVLEMPSFQAYLTQEIKKIILVPGKLINIVV